MSAAEPQVHLAALTDLSPTLLHDLLRLRADVFVVEQACPYPDLDGRDTEPGTLHAWVEDDGAVVSAARILREPDGSVAVGRVVTRADHRGCGLSEHLLRAVLDHLRREAGLAGSAGVGGSAGTGEPVRVVIGAQAHLEGWYARLGFARTGPDYLEDGIPHLPMALTLT